MECELKILNKTIGCCFLQKYCRLKLFLLRRKIKEFGRSACDTIQVKRMNLKESRLHDTQVCTIRITV